MCVCVCVCVCVFVVVFYRVRGTTWKFPEQMPWSWEISSLDALVLARTNGKGSPTMTIKTIKAK